MFIKTTLSQTLNKTMSHKVSENLHNTRQNKLEPLSCSAFYVLSLKASCPLHVVDVVMGQFTFVCLQINIEVKCQVYNNIHSLTYKIHLIEDDRQNHQLFDVY